MSIFCDESTLCFPLSPQLAFRVKSCTIGPGQLDLKNHVHMQQSNMQETRESHPLVGER